MSGLPGFVTKYFWGDDIKELSWGKNSKYVTETILNRGNTKAINWLFGRVEKRKLADELNNYKLNPKSANFWKLYLS
ncbi:MAG: hypothetical protein ABII21_01975 [bacterium]